MFVDDADMFLQMNSGYADSACLSRWTQGNPLGSLIARRAAMLHNTTGGSSENSVAPIWVFSTKILTVEWFESVHNTVADHSAEITPANVTAWSLLKIG